ncbi:MAG: glycosyltransferase family 4 protein [Phycisphaerales bacterium]|nr:MAG: glycosyltransferase family 4 protein [Phycisphaerales bacterium]
MRRKLVYPSTALIPSAQANSVQIMKMCNALCRFGFDVTLLAGTLPGYGSVNVYEYYGVENTFSIVRKVSGCRRGSTFFLSLRNYPTLKNLAGSRQNILFYGRDVLALYVLARAGRQVMYETHDIVRKGPRSWAERRLIEGQNLRKIVFISSELKRAYLEKYGTVLADKKMIVAPDAADEQPDFSETFRLNGGARFNACYVGGLHRGRGVELILEVAGRMPEVGFHLFGGAVNQIRPLEQTSSPNVHFYGHITPAQTYKVRNAADVLLMPYQREVVVAQNASETSRWMSPVKLFEYMSSRKPIVSSNHKVLQEVLEHNRNCLLCEPDDPTQWVRAIASAKEDEQLSRRISETAYRDFVDHYTWDKRVRRILADDEIAVKEWSCRS